MKKKRASFEEKLPMILEYLNNKLPDTAYQYPLVISLPKKNQLRYAGNSNKNPMKKLLIESTPMIPFIESMPDDYSNEDDSLYFKCSDMISFDRESFASLSYEERYLPDIPIMKSTKPKAIESSYKPYQIEPIIDSKISKIKPKTATNWFYPSPREISPASKNSLNEKSKPPISNDSSCKSVLRKRKMKARPCSGHPIATKNTPSKPEPLSIANDIQIKSGPILKDLEKNVVRSQSPNIPANPQPAIKKRSLPRETPVIFDPNQKRRPLMSGALTDKADKHRENNLDILLMNKNNYDLKLFMQEYNRRQGLPEGSKIFIVTGQFEFIRRELKARGWIENKQSTSQAFHLKWIYSDTDNDYKVLRPGQLINHFNNNRELTTKSGLLKNLRNFCENNVNIDTFFPRCYDLGDNVQIKEFIQDYQNTAIINIVKKHADFFQSDYDLQPVNLRLLSLAIQHTQMIVGNIFDQCEKIHDVVNNEDFNYNSYIKDEDMKSLLEYSDFDFPIKIQPETWDYPNKELVQTCIELKNTILKILPQAEMEGVKNIWIIKPGQNARGSGVRCVHGLQEILDCGKQMQSRIVQKYVEKPFLIPTSSGLCKFDIRQWALVTSFSPLTIYFFNSCYLRLCQQAYNLDTLDAYTHLANYSLQKNVAKAQEDTVWRLSQFIEYLSSKDISWDEAVLPKIHSIITRTLQAVSDNIDTRPECFELYGFDVMLDEKLTPWLLETNLSPACAERTEWLSNMLNAMGKGLFDIVIDGAGNDDPLYSQDLKQQKKIYGNSLEWVLIYKGLEIPSDIDPLNCNLEVCGTKFNVKRERKIERRIQVEKAALVIQRETRKFLIKVRAERAMELKNSLIVQHFLRRKFAYMSLAKQILIVSAIKIQCIYRGYKAKKIAKELRKIRAIRHIQAMMRGWKSRENFKERKTAKAILRLQRGLRRKFASLEINRAKYYLQQISFIQRMWKRRFRLLNKKAIMIQKLYRGYLGRKIYFREKHFQSIIITIQISIRTLLAKHHLKHIKVARASSIISKFEFQRKNLSCMVYYKTNSAALTIQKHIRRFFAQKLLANLKNEKKMLVNAIMLIQKHLRGKKSRLQYEKIIRNRAATTIQKYIRGLQARDYYKILKLVNKSAIIIQKYYRAYRARRKFQMMKRIQKQEHERRKRLAKIKKEQEVRAIKASERLYSGKHGPEIQQKIKSKTTENFFDEKLSLKKEETKVSKVRDSVDGEVINAKPLKGQWASTKTVASFVKEEQLYYRSDYIEKKPEKQKLSKRFKKFSPYEQELLRQ
ncbi:unnamed protein product [Blepharisma stoltei]|uniref:Uncharacterized protein n=1 Tax=Blepharisma stoltei TaxID=1481888 RepID=A0AAU9KLD6_9CILI|nr:unnamed protein product [Blepharisma stoltei]